MSAMNAFSSFANQTLRGLARLFTLALLGTFVASLLLLGVAVALLSVLWSLLRGKRPAMFTVFSTFQQASRQFGQRRAGAPRGTAASDAGEVVDVQAHEVRQALGGTQQR